MLGNHIGLRWKRTQVFLLVHIPGAVVDHLKVVPREVLVAQHFLLLMHHVEAGIGLLRSHHLIPELVDGRVPVCDTMLVFVAVLVGEQLQVIVAQCLTIGHQRHGRCVPGKYLMSLPGQSLLLDLPQNTLGLLLCCCLVSMHRLLSLLHRDTPLV